MRLRLGLVLILSLLLLGCAGPTTPFGALNGFGEKVKEIARYLGLRGSQATISFAPGRQLLHDRANFEAVIEDPKGIPPQHRVTLTYNGMDMTHTYLRFAKRTYLDQQSRRMKLTLSDFRLPAKRDHHILLTYWRDAKSAPVSQEYEPPVCPPFEMARQLASVPKFPAPSEVIESINTHANQGRFNPYLIAGLIAQESSFNPLAVSPSKALGLTQITSMGAAEIAESHWPRFTGLEEMSALEVRLAIYKGEISADNEWRLNPELSVQGGVSYLAYLYKYWDRPDKRAQLESLFGELDPNLSEIILASYNSGATRVSRAIDRHGKDWLKDQELNEARKYVRRVVSYCDHFAHGGDRQ